jgi:hypothetical protein
MEMRNFTIGHYKCDIFMGASGLQLVHPSIITARSSLVFALHYSTRGPEYIFFPKGLFILVAGAVSAQLQIMNYRG